MKDDKTVSLTLNFEEAVFGVACQLHSCYRLNRM